MQSAFVGRFSPSKHKVEATDEDQEASGKKHAPANATGSSSRFW
jgi:hypothetical protein